MNNASSLLKACEFFKDSLKACDICPRKCLADRSSGRAGYCRAPYNPVVYSYMPHRGEEPPISGRRGSGAIFFSHCNMKCAYCQNYSFSQLDKGNETSIDRLAEMMLSLENSGCHNINLVSPTHFVPRIISALQLAFDKGLNIPIAYNTGGYERVETIRALSGIVDIYMPDMRYSSNEMAERYSDAPGYVDYDRPAVAEMHRQVGDLVMDKNGIAKRGLIIRLLALPQAISGTEDSLRYIKEKISKNTYISLMSQYYPTFKASNYKELSRGVNRDEYKNVVDACRVLGLNNGWIQEMSEEPDDKFLGANIKQKDLKNDAQNT
ncbi:MAG: radical SAM protein [Candidatus Omnitrophota bacterium]|nr:radical SAM protein [Candidatus Omnitrophota bacterium]